MRGVTACAMMQFCQQCISTHTPHARRDRAAVSLFVLSDISTHTPHARRDALSRALAGSVIAFLLTRLMRGVTDQATMTELLKYISTHTPHARRDSLLLVVSVLR